LHRFRPCIPDHHLLVYVSRNVTGVHPETLVASGAPMNAQCVDGSDDGNHITDAFARSLYLGVGLDG
jgi:hypothetical protein